MKQILPSLQRVGGALMLPIAVLPIAGLLLRLGQPDLLDLPFMAAAGDAIFSDLGLLFAIGVAIGLARENHGAAGLASVVGYLVTTRGAQVLIAVPPEVLAGLPGQARDLAAAAYKAHELGKLSVPVGIISGLIGGTLYNRCSNIRLPSYLAFFGGRRFVPIASGFAGLILAAVFGREWQPLETGMDALSHSVVNAGAFGLFAYGVLNRVLIVTGLHHILNNIAFFLLGDYHGTTGDLKRFFAGDPTAGTFMAGFFPVMMFGLPAACLAMYHAAKTERRKAVAGLLMSIALTSALTGVTEPIEFTFMFLAPALYAVHAVLTGVAFVIMNALHVRLGFGFSAGLFDYVLNYSKATRPLMLIPVGLLYFALYYWLFRFVIVRFNLKTPGREDEAAVTDDGATSGFAAANGSVAESGRGVGGVGAVGGGVAAGTGRAAGIGRAIGMGHMVVGGPALELALGYIAALGGPANIVSLDACMTRLRLVVTDQSAVNADALKRLGARGVVKPSANALQVVVGTNADQVAGDIKAALKAGAAVGGGSGVPVAASAGAAGAPNAAGVGGGVPGAGGAADGPGALGAASAGATRSGPRAPSAAPGAIAAQTLTSLLAALGGRSNVKIVESVSTRLRINIVNPDAVDTSRIVSLGMRGVAIPSPNWVHVIVGPGATEAGSSLQQLLGTG
jgi:N-acetylglucosamine PTS system EIICBA or EIICB component